MSQKTTPASKHYMYVVECADGTWYTGYTTDVERRVAAHNAGRGAKYTRVRRPVRLLAQAAFATKHEAMSAEYHFKQLGRTQKELLVAQAGSAMSFEELLLQSGLVSTEAPATCSYCQKGPDLMTDPALTVRHATPGDVDALAALEAQCFPPAEAATREQFVERVAAFPDHFWLLERNGELVASINGMVTDSPTIADEMFADASMHDERGAWQAIFGVETAPAHQRQGYAALLMERVVEDARSQGRRGCTLTCKEALIPYYERFGYVNCGVSASEHGGAVWYDMRVEF